MRALSRQWVLGSMFGLLAFSSVFAQIAPTAAQSDECLNLPKLVEEIEKAIRAGGELVQETTDLEVLAGKDKLDDEWLRNYGANVLQKDNKETFKKWPKTVQDGCKSFSIEDKKDGLTKMNIVGFSKTEIGASPDWTAIYDELVATTEKTNGKEIADQLRKSRKEWFSEHSDSYQWIFRKEKDGELSSIVRVREQGVEIEAKVTLKWGKNLVAPKINERVTEFEKRVAAAQLKKAK